MARQNNEHARVQARTKDTMPQKLFLGSVALIALMWVFAGWSEEYNAMDPR
ncbi:MAG: hypothetical protein ACE5F4_01630 [Candidatus Paceibacteria bacterium]